MLAYSLMLSETVRMQKTVSTLNEAPDLSRYQKI